MLQDEILALLRGEGFDGIHTRLPTRTREHFEPHPSGEVPKRAKCSKRRRSARGLESSTLDSGAPERHILSGGMILAMPYYMGMRVLFMLCLAAAAVHAQK